jgi:hypothetical protein
MNIESCEHCGYPLTSGSNKIVAQVCDIHFVVYTKCLFSQLLIVKNILTPVSASSSSTAEATASCDLV